MTPCDRIATAGRYHDGELSGDARAEFELHLSGCPACARELEELRAVSRRLAAGRNALPGLAAPALAHMHRSIERRRSVYEMATMARKLTAVAAIILVACTLWLFVEREAPPQASGTSAALDIEKISLLSDPTTASASPETQLAQLIATDTGGSHD